MIGMLAAAWFLMIPPWEITATESWYDQEVEEIPHERSLDDLEREIERERRFEQFKVDLKSRRR